MTQTNIYDHATVTAALERLNASRENMQAIRANSHAITAPNRYTSKTPDAGHQH